MTEPALLPFASWESAIPRIEPAARAMARTVTLAHLEAPDGLVNARLERSGSGVAVRAEARQFLDHGAPTPIPSLGLTETRPAQSRSAGFRPAHLGLSPVPRRPPPELAAAPPPWPPRPLVSPGRATAELVFAPDDRRTYYDTSLPWSACGRIEGRGYTGSGVMVGPRHVLTARHNIVWTGGVMGPLRFQPHYYDGLHPRFGQAAVTRVFFWKETNDPASLDEEMAFDLAVCVLDGELGTLTGYLKAAAWDPAWNGQASLALLGYPGDVHSGQRPVFRGGGAIDSTTLVSQLGHDAYVMYHRMDMAGGDSGGPLIGWIDKSPHVVGVVSGEQAASGRNYCAGGTHLKALVDWALATEP
jgi:hypothetical protein